MIEGTTGLMEETMFDASGRPIGRLSYWVMAAVMMCGLVWTASGRELRRRVDRRLLQSRTPCIWPMETRRRGI
jgi:hypothetical protein